MKRYYLVKTDEQDSNAEVLCMYTNKNAAISRCAERRKDKEENKQQERFYVTNSDHFSNENGYWFRVLPKMIVF